MKKTDYTKKWLKILNVECEESGCYRYYNFRINYNKSLSSSRNAFIDVRDIETNRILRSYGKIKLGYNRTLVDLKFKTWDELLIESLIKIIADSPELKLIKKNIQQIDEIQNNSFFDLDSELLPIEKFTVFVFKKCTSKRIIYRPGEDDKYRLTLKTNWFVLFNDLIVQNEYIKSLLPPPNLREWEEEVFGSGPKSFVPTKFEIDNEETGKFRKRFNMVEFRS